jgi:DNA-binding LytR/AlgR family response regulator
MNCIIIDDEKTSRVILKTLCDQTNLNVINEFSNAIEAIKYLNNHDVDVVFLDYHMPSFNGLDFIKTLKKPINIILTTSDPKFAIEAFEYDFIIDYLLKPIEISRFKKSIYKVTNKLVSPTDVTKQPEINKVFYVNVDRRLIKIEIDSIYVIEASGDYIIIKTEAENYVVHSTLRKINNKLPDNMFIQVHRSFIINIKQIIDIQDNTVLVHKEIVPISRSKRSILIKRLDFL